MLFLSFCVLVCVFCLFVHFFFSVSFYIRGRKCCSVFFLGNHKKEQGLFTMFRLALLFLFNAFLPAHRTKDFRVCVDICHAFFIPCSFILFVFVFVCVCFSEPSLCDKQIYSSLRFLY